MQDQFFVLNMRVLVQMVNAVGIEKRGAALDAMHFVTLREQESSEVGAVLAGDAGDKGCFFCHFSITRETLVIRDTQCFQIRSVAGCRCRQPPSCRQFSQCLAGLARFLDERASKIV